MYIDSRTRLGKELKRLIGNEAVRWRMSNEVSRFLLADCSDCDAGRLVRDERQLQLVGGDSAPLVIDIDSLHPENLESAADACFASERLVCSTRVLDAMLRSRYGVQMSWFSSGKQGLHGFAFGTTLSKPMRDAVAELLPGDQSVFTHDAWTSPEVQSEVDAALERLLSLDLSSCRETEWAKRLHAAAVPTASQSTKLMAVTAFFDKCVTVSAQIRVPFAHNAKDCGYAGFALPPTTDASTAWPSIRRSASAPLQPDELALLESIELPALHERKEISEKLKADTHHSRKRTLGAMEEHRLLNWVPRLHTRSVSLPDDASVRASLIQWPVRRHLPPDVIAALEQGIRQGGTPPCSWAAEPDDDHRREVSSRGGGTGHGSQPLALEALVGLNLTAAGRGSVARSLFISAFPVDCFAEALKASPKVRKEVLAHWGSWFHTLAKGGSKVGAVAWRYDGGFLDEVAVQSPEVRKQCARAAQVLTGRATTVNSATSKMPAARRPAAANGTSTGRRVTVVLAGTVAQQMEQVHSALESRARSEASDGEFGAAHRLNQLKERAERDLNSLHFAAADSTLVFEEYIASEGRLGYACGEYRGIKAVLRELRPVLFDGMWRVDIRRCHTSMLIGAHGRALRLGSATNNELLHRMRTCMADLEAQLREEQQQLRSAALVHSQESGGTDAESYAVKYLKYLEMEPKTLLSAMLNHPSKSPMFSRWPLAHKCCEALGEAAAAARSHPLVAADRLRPELCGIPQGSAAEKQRVAILLERRAVIALVASLEKLGLRPSITINDEVLFAAPTGGAAELEQTLSQDLEATMGFAAGLSVNRVL